MRKSNFALRLQPSLLAELRKAAAEDDVTLNQYINVAVAEKLATRRTAAEFFAQRAIQGSAVRAFAILQAAGSDEPEPATDSDELILPP